MLDHLHNETLLEQLTEVSQEYIATAKQASLSGYLKSYQRTFLMQSRARMKKKQRIEAKLLSELIPSGPGTLWNVNLLAHLRDSLPIQLI